LKVSEYKRYRKQIKAGLEIYNASGSTRLMMSNAKFKAEFEGLLTPGQAHM
jgi:hypothetical protein